MILNLTVKWSVGAYALNHVWYLADHEKKPKFTYLSNAGKKCVGNSLWIKMLICLKKLFTKGYYIMEGSKNTGMRTKSTDTGLHSDERRGRSARVRRSLVNWWQAPTPNAHVQLHFLFLSKCHLIVKGSLVVVINIRVTLCEKLCPCCGWQRGLRILMRMRLTYFTRDSTVHDYADGRVGPLLDR